MTLSSTGSVMSCFHGTQSCEQGVWSPCTDGSVSEQALPGWLASGNLSVLALSDQEECLDNPCDPYCQQFEEEPDAPLISTETGEGGSFDWSQGSLAGYPAGLVKKGLVEPCQTGFDCQFNMRCESPDYGSCSHSVCEQGTALDDECNDCVSLICAQDSTCCVDEAASTPHTCSHDPCVTGTRLKTTCSPCVASICASMPSCCSTSGSWTAACAAAVVTTCGNSCTCNTDETSYGSSCYFYEDSDDDWTDAKNDCISRGTGWNLVSINDSNENTYVKSLNDGNNRWIGLTDSATEGTWVWASGSPSGNWKKVGGGTLYQNFRSGEPSSSSSSEDCARMNSSNGNWDDASCSTSTKYEYVCEGPGTVMKVAPSTNAWTASCVAKVASVCDATCDTDDPSNNAGSCIPWYPGETDTTCTGIDLTVGIPCDGVIPICNHGQTEAPAGVEVVHLPANSDQYPNCTADTTQANASTCTTTEPIPPGECINLADTTCVDKQGNSSPMGQNRTIMVNPTGAITECSCQDNWSLFNKGSSCGGPVCAGGSTAATQVNKPVDIIFIIDNSGSMAGEIEQVQTRINVDLAATLSASGLDYRVIMVSRFGDVDVAVGDSDHPICVGAPLGANACTNPSSETLVNNSPKYFHYSANIGSTDGWCQLLYGFNHADEINEQRNGWVDLAPNGWGEWLRSDSFKTFVMITDDEVDCNDYSYDFDDLGTANGGTSTAAAFDTALLTLSPTHFGTSTDRNYIWHSIVGMVENPAGATVAWDSSAAIQTSECTPTSESEAPGTGHQALSKLTGGLRYPICQNSNFNAIFTAITEAVIESAAASCEFSLPDADTFSEDGAVVAWSDSAETNHPLTQVASAGSCTDSGWYFDDPDAPTVLTLCPGACEDVQADSGAQVWVELQCPSATSYEPTTYTETYVGECDNGYAPQWNFLTYTADVPVDTNITFRARTADTAADLQNATWVDVSTATNTNPSCELADSSDDCPVVLYDLLGNGYARLPYLELEATLTPTESATPTLEDWQITFSCPPDE